MRELLIIRTGNSEQIKDLLSKGKADFEIIHQEKIALVKRSTGKFGFPPPEEFEKVLKRIERPGYRRINISLLPEASKTDKAKYKLCLGISRYRRENKLSELELRDKLGVNQAKLEYVLFKHLDKVNLSELRKFTRILNNG